MNEEDYLRDLSESGAAPAEEEDNGRSGGSSGPELGGAEGESGLGSKADFTQNEPGQDGSGKYDAIVVGAGPAGCSASLFLANAGRRVLLLDKAQFPRDKVCGDAFSGKSIGVARELGLLSGIESFSHGIVRGVKMVAPNGKEVSVPFPNADGMGFAGYTIARADLDGMLFGAARSHRGVQAIQNFRADGLLRDAGGAVCGITGTDMGDGLQKTFEARVVVGADGAASAVARLLRLPPVPVGHVYSAVRGYWDGVQGLGENIELFFMDGVLPGYLWIFPMGNGRANVGLGILSSDVTKRRQHPATILLEALKSPLLSGRFAGAKLDGKIGAWAIPLGSFRRQCHGDGWLLVGDAAVLVDPFSGEGIGNALVSGKYAAEAINSALSSAGGSDGTPLSAPSLSGYASSLDSCVRPELENSHRLQRLSRFRFLLNLFIGKAAEKPEARQMVISMLASEDEKKKVESPLFYLKLLLP